LKKNRYISLSILAIFAISYLGQSLHIISHNADGHNHAFSCGHHHATHYTTEKETSGKSEQQLDTIKDHCPICEFHFIDFTSQQIPFIGKSLKLHIRKSSTEEPQNYFGQVIQSYLLRGPPIA